MIRNKVLQIPYVVESDPPSKLKTEIAYAYPRMPCDANKGQQVTGHVAAVVAGSQCVQEGTCEASVTYTCSGSGINSTMTITITLTSQPTFDGSGLNVDKLAQSNSTGRQISILKHNHGKTPRCVFPSTLTLTFLDCLLKTSQYQTKRKHVCNAKHC